MTAVENFVAGVYLQEEGYVLGIKGDNIGRSYYRMPADQKLKDLQLRGLLSDPLPKYSLSVVDYASGYSLWWITPVALGVLYLMRRRRNRL